MILLVQAAIRGILLGMDLDPHTLHQIIQRIQQQMRCPQCGGKVPVEVGSVRLTGEDFMLLQLKCTACEAYIVLHASLQGMKARKENDAGKKGVNASSSLCVDVEELTVLRDSIASAGGSFGRLFSAPSDQAGPAATKKIA